MLTKDHEIKVTSVDLEENNVVKIVGTKFSEKKHFEVGVSVDSASQKATPVIPESHIEIFKIPGKRALGVAAGGYGKGWFGAMIDYVFYSGGIKVKSDSLLVDKAAAIGSIRSFSGQNKGEYFTLDRTSEFVVELDSGQLFSIPEEEIFITNRNLALIGSEFVKFHKAKLQQDGTYIISHLLRGLYGTSTNSYDTFVLLDENTL